MKTIFQNKECIILYDDRSFHPEESNVTRVAGYLGFDALAMAHEVWIYKPATKNFYAYKIDGLINEAIHRIFEFGIKLKVCAASIDTACAQELRFETSKDEFLFKLKF